MLKDAWAARREWPTTFYLTSGFAWPVRPRDAGPATGRAGEPRMPCNDELLERAADAHGALELEKTISRYGKRSDYVSFLLFRLGIL